MYGTVTYVKDVFAGGQTRFLSKGAGGHPRPTPSPNFWDMVRQTATKLCAVIVL